MDEQEIYPTGNEYSNEYSPADIIIEDDKPPMWKRILSWVLRSPLIALVLISWLVSFYAAYAKIQGMTYTVPAIYTIFVVLFFIGLWIAKRK